MSSHDATTSTDLRAQILGELSFMHGYKSVQQMLIQNRQLALPVSSLRSCDPHRHYTQGILGLLLCSHDRRESRPGRQNFHAVRNQVWSQPGSARVTRRYLRPDQERYHSQREC